METPEPRSSPVRRVVAIVRSAIRQGTPPRLLVATLVVSIFFILRGTPAFFGEDAPLTILSSYSPATLLLMLGLGLLAFPPALRELRARYDRRNMPGHLPYIMAMTGVFAIAQVALLARGPERPSWGPFAELLVALALVHAVFLTFRTRQDLRWLGMGIVAAGLTTGLYLMTFLLPGEGLGTNRGAGIGAEGATYNTVAYMLAAALWVGPAAYFVARRDGRLVGTLAATVAGIVLVVGILLTGTKGALVAIALLVPLAYVLMQGNSQAGRLRVWGPVAALAIVALLLLALLLQGISAAQRVAELFTPATLTLRNELWGHALPLLFSQPWTLFVGVGAGQYYYYDGSYAYTYPHNLFLDAALSGGIFAAILLFAVVARGFWGLSTLLRDPACDPEVRRLAVMLAGFGVVSIFAAFIAFKLSSNIMLWLWIGATARLTFIARSSPVGVTFLASPHQRTGIESDRSSRDSLQPGAR